MACHNPKRIVLFFVFGTCVLFFACHTDSKPKEKEIAQTLINQTDSFVNLCNQMKSAVTDPHSDKKQLQNIFLQTRIAYKKIEWATEYFDPAGAKSVNGPPVQEVELSGQIIQPTGLQIMEGILFPDYDTAKKNELSNQIDILLSAAGKFKNRLVNVDIFDWQVFDAAKLEIFRIETLGITGFDNPLTLESLTESEAALNTVGEAIAYYDLDNDTSPVKNKITPAASYLETHRDFNSFDRMEFIEKFCNPITIGISELEKKLKIHVIRYNRLLNQDAETLFDSNAFNVNAYAPDHSSFISDEKILLGKALFSDPILSGTGKRSCRSCHQPEKAFADGMIKNTVIGESDLLPRNTPTLINAALQPALFYDLRANTLEDQSHTVVHSNKEMHGDMEVSVKKLWADRKYRQMFRNAFPYEDSAKIDTFEIMNAIGSFVRSLVFLNSPFDQYMRGDKSKMNAVEIHGFNLFMGKAKCATCHYMPLFNGTFPPRFNKIESEVIGVPKDIHGKEIDEDKGRFEIIKLEANKYAFKTPTVRNAAQTAPYMHNGVFGTLEEVMDFYNKGGGRGLGIVLSNQTLPFDRLSLSKQEQQDIISFIKTLDSRLPAGY